MFGLPAGAQAAFPGENGKIVFDSERVAPNQVSLFTVDSDGAGLSGPIGALAFRPAWSADGTKIAFTCGYVGVICVTDADGSNGYSIFGTGIPADDPAWAPDGQRIVFSKGTTTACALEGCGDELYTIKTDGSELTRLTNDPAFDYQPAWSPDGSRIAFTRRACGVCEDHIYLINPDGTGLTRLTAPGKYYAQPSWSPDGTRIAYRGNHPSQFDAQIYTMKSDGTDQQQVTFSASPFVIALEPAWSPDGNRIAFTGHPNGLCGGTDCGYEIFTIRTDGTDRRRVTDDRARDADPDWQPIPNRPPDCSGVAASRPVLTTVNRRLVPITLDGASDPDGDPVTLSVDGVTQDEPVTSSGDHSSPDAIDEGEGELRIRAERNPHGDGRVYRIAFTASDGRGGSCSDTTKVSVPRKKHKAAVDSAPPSYDSFGR
jgi:Tol biopolymer transport system component